MFSLIKSNNGGKMKKERMMKSQIRPSWITILRRRGPLLFSDFVIAGQSREYFQKMLGFDFEIKNFKYIDGEISIDVNEVSKLAGIVDQKIKQDPQFLKEFIDKCKAQCETLLNLSKQIPKMHLESLTNDELKRLFEVYVEEVLKMMPFLNIFAIMERMFDKKFRLDLKKNLAQ